MLPSFAQIKHKFLAVDNGLNHLLLVDEINNKGWTINIPAGSRDLQILPGNKILVSHGNGAAEYNLTDGTKGWFTDKLANITTSTRLDNGNTLIGGNVNGVTLYEILPNGTEKSHLTLSALSDIRLARRLKNGNTLLGLAAPHQVVEVDSLGTTVWTGALTDKGYVGYRLPNGHTIATSGEDCFIYDFSADGKATVIAGGLANHPTDKMLWFSGFEILPNGNFLVANWNGHGMEGKGPHAFEFTPQNKIVWTWDDAKIASTVTNVLNLEETPVMIAPQQSKGLASIKSTPPEKMADALGRAQKSNSNHWFKTIFRLHKLDPDRAIK